MKRRYLAVVVALLVGIGLACLARITRGRAAAAPPSADRRSVQLTVYAEDFGMVREIRGLSLTKGMNRLSLGDVSKQMDPESVLLRWQEQGPAAPQLVAHAYDLGVGDSDGLLKRYLGKSVQVVRYGDNGREAERQSGILMNATGGQIVLQSDGQFFIHPPGTIVAPTDPSIVTIPQLTVQANSPAAQSDSLEVAYLTRGLSWNSDYVGTLSPKDDTVNLECWATVTNRTGIDYPNATVTLIAGAPNRAAVTADNGVQYQSRVLHKTPMAALPPETPAMPNLAGGAPSTVGDFHAYRLAQPTTVVQEQMNRLLLLGSAHVPIKRDYSAEPPTLTAWDDGYGAESQPQHGDVTVAVTFFNKAADGLGAPLPAGTMRVYETDAVGTLRYAGAAGIPDTPKDQKVSVTLAKAFDVFTEWRILRSQKLSKHAYRKQVELMLHNEKATPVSVRVVQNFDGRWHIVHEPLAHVNLAASRAQWTVRVPAGGQTALDYTVEFAV